MVFSSGDCCSPVVTADLQLSVLVSTGCASFCWVRVFSVGLRLFPIVFIGLLWCPLFLVGLQCSLVFFSGLCRAPAVSAGLKRFFDFQQSLLAFSISSDLSCSVLVSRALQCQVVPSDFCWSMLDSNDHCMCSNGWWSLLVFSGLC